LVSISAEGNPVFRCPSTTGRPCVLIEEIQGDVVFTAFDPLNGKGVEQLADIRCVHSPASMSCGGSPANDTNPVASPDGRYLTFGEMTEEGNAWLRTRSGAMELQIRPPESGNQMQAGKRRDFPYAIV
jgi:hypothetical protein